MSVKQPLLLSKLRCGECKSVLLSVKLMHMGTTDGIDHIDIYCGVCETFIIHFNVSPFEELTDVEEDKTED